MESRTAQATTNERDRIWKRAIAYATLRGVTCQSYSRCAAPQLFGSHLNLTILQGQFSQHGLEFRKAQRLGEHFLQAFPPLR